MAATPTFLSTPFAAVAAVSTANTNRDGTGTIVDIGGTAPAAGRKITKIVVKATGDPADSIVTIFIHNGTSYFLFDEFDIGNPAAGSTVLPAYREERIYDELLVSGWKLAAAITVALTAGVVNVFANGGDLT